MSNRELVILDTKCNMFNFGVEQWTLSIVYISH
jgi:hypothetical protein